MGRNNLGIWWRSTNYVVRVNCSTAGDGRNTIVLRITASKYVSLQVVNSAKIDIAHDGSTSAANKFCNHTRTRKVAGKSS